MAGTKEAIAIVLDVGPSMNQAPPGGESSLQTSLDAIQRILQRKMFAESKDEVSLILFGTPDTANPLAGDGLSYENITVAQPLGPTSWDLIQYTQNDIQASNIPADFVDALIVAMDHLMTNTQGKRGFGGGKRLILFTDLGGEFGDDQIESIILAMKQADVHFNVIGPDIGGDDDDEDEDEPKPSTSAGGATANGGRKEKTPQQQLGEKLVKHIVEKVDGECYSFSEALPALSFFQKREVRPTPWKATLEVGPDLKIPVQGFIKSQEAKVKSFKKVYARETVATTENVRTFHLNNEEETEIEKEDTVMGHRYGNTLVPFSTDDLENMKYSAEKGFKVLGFTKMENIKRHHILGTSCMVFIPDKGDEAAAMAISALIHAMDETQMVPVVRKVYSARSSPRIGFLTPYIKVNYECLYWNELPYSEDVRQFTFGSLPLKEGATINKKYEPSSQQLDAVDDLITSMDLTKANEDEDEEALKPKLTFNPYLQRLYQCLQHRAFNPNDPLPDLSPLIANYLQAPKVIATRCAGDLDKVKELFKLERKEHKKEDTGESMLKDSKNSDDGPAAKKARLDDDLARGMADLAKSRVTEVGTVNPVEDFRTIIRQKDEDRFEEACKMMQKRITSLIMDSFGSQFYGKALDCLKVLREETIKNGEPNLFNSFLRELKETLGEKNKKDFWSLVVQGKISLISSNETAESSVTQSEAAAFLEEEKKEEEEEAVPDDDDEDADDLLAQM